MNAVYTLNTIIDCCGNSTYHLVYILVQQISRTERSRYGFLAYGLSASTSVWNLNSLLPLLYPNYLSIEDNKIIKYRERSN